jgi:hypothetical protein
VDRKPAVKPSFRGILTCSPLRLYRGRLVRSEGFLEQNHPPPGWAVEGIEMNEFSRVPAGESGR